jgi:hypothetical protein
MAFTTNKIINSMEKFEDVVDNSRCVFFRLIIQQLEKGQIGLEFIQDEIKLLFKAIKYTKDIKESDLIFDNLQVIHFVLSKVYFTTDIQITPFLKEFIHDFERIDDSDIKKYQYQKIKHS